MRARRFVLLVLAGLLATIALVPTFAAALPGRDQGVFLYAGQRILRGEVPYRDVWDHKGPLIYYINALGLLIGGGSVWGVRLLELLSLWLATFVGLMVMEEAFGLTAAALSSFAWVVSLPALIDGGNVTEEYSLPLGFVSLWLAWRMGRNNRVRGHPALLGACMGLNLLIRPNNIGLQLTILAYLILSDLIAGRRRQGRMVALRTVLVAAGVVGVALILFSSASGLGQFYDAYIRYNIYYSTAVPTDRLLSAWRGIRALLPSGLSIVALLAWGRGIIYLAGRKVETRGGPLVVIALVALPVEVLLSSMSGRAYDHYFVLWLPVMAILAAFVLQAVLGFARSRYSSRPRQRAADFVIAVGFVLATGAVPFTRMSPDLLRVLTGGPESDPPLVEYIIRHTSEEDYLLVWGAETTYNFLSGRPSPSRFAYQYPLYSCEYRTPDMVDEFYWGIAERHPMIVDTSSTNLRVPPIDPESREAWNSRYGGCALNYPMDEVTGYLDAEYRLVDEIEPEGWYVYTFRGESPR